MRLRKGHILQGYFKEGGGEFYKMKKFHRSSDVGKNECLVLLL